MARTLPPLTRLVLGIAIGALVVLGIKFGAQASGYRLSGVGALGVAVAWILVGSWLVFRYWRGIDEAAREAQKWAWYWGGSLGLGVGVLAVNWGLVDLPALLPADASRKEIMLFGAVTVMVAQGVGFLGAWAAWWWSRR